MGGAYFSECSTIAGLGHRQWEACGYYVSSQSLVRVKFIDSGVSCGWAAFCLVGVIWSCCCISAGYGGQSIFCFIDRF